VTVKHASLHAFFAAFEAFLNPGQAGRTKAVRCPSSSDRNAAGGGQGQHDARIDAPVKRIADGDQRPANAYA